MVKSDPQTLLSFPEFIKESLPHYLHCPDPSEGPGDRHIGMLREMWLNIRVEKVDTHERMIVKVPLDSGITEMFMNRKMTAKHGFRLQKLV